MGTAISGRFAPPRPRLYDIYFERARDVRLLERLGIRTEGSVTNYDGHACTKAFLDSSQRADLSKHASLRPLEG